MSFHFLNQMVDSIALAVTMLCFVWVILKHQRYSSGILFFLASLVALEIAHLIIHLLGDSHEIDAYRAPTVFDYTLIMKLIHTSIDDIVVVMAAFLAVKHTKVRT